MKRRVSEASSISILGAMAERAQDPEGLGGATRERLRNADAPVALRPQGVPVPPPCGESLEVIERIIRANRMPSEIEIDREATSLAGPANEAWRI